MKNRKKKKGAGVFVDGNLVAWFADPEHAQDYAKNYYFGQWLMLPHKISVSPQLKITKEDQREAKKMFRLLNMPG